MMEDTPVAKDIFHVVPHNDGWSVKREGNERASSVHTTQKEAIDSARSFARDGDDIVIHRADGTIREHVTPAVTIAEPARSRETVQLRDIVPVGSRVSWPAVLAGVAVALTAYICLTLLALAIGITTVDHVRARTFAVGAAIVGVFNLLVALFLGGYVASGLTAGETRREAGTYGVLVWGALFATLLLTGLNVGGTLAMLGQPNRTGAEPTAATPAQIDAQRRADAVATRGEQLVADMNPTAVAWWAFAGTALSVLAAIGGGLAGAGPEIVLRTREARERTEGARAVTVQPA